MGKTLLMINMSYASDWDEGIVNRNFHILQSLKKEEVFDTIVSVDFPPYSVKTKLRALLKTKTWKKNKETVHRGGGIRIDAQDGNKKMLAAYCTSLSSLPKALKKVGIQTDDLVVWSYDPFATSIRRLFPNALYVFDAVDNWTEHPSHVRRKAMLGQAYKTIQRDADIIFTVSEGLVDFFNKSEKAFFVPNGVDAFHFSAGVCNTALIPDTKGPIVGYHGIIQDRINFSVIDFISDKLPDHQFVIAGPVWKSVEDSVKRLGKKPNVNFINQIPYEELPNLIQCFDVAIIPHKVDALTQSMNPLKIYEYLAAGKPIVASPIAGADQFQDLIKLAVSPEEFTVKIQKAIELDSQELIDRRKSMAKMHSWTQRIHTMLEIMESRTKKS
ncbi:MAG: glycosyltransferase [Candidatus Kerfeldbacteria bacterium]